MDILLTWLIFVLLFLAIGYILGARNRSAARREDEASETPKGIRGRDARRFPAAGNVPRCFQFITH